MHHDSVTATSPRSTIQDYSDIINKQIEDSSKLLKEYALRSDIFEDFDQIGDL